ncbi:hypothetical protein N6H18_06115 [Reichenbachiella agarivorans]|uniref:Uncharacterized protein n=1 Tax=Reichenbachiella agarivorans TaxID=2979464 RepID=A0ABY6CSN6_9BACT|nr:hypothetical protein [Reichenbachiella agarivorans]UXP33527.1 hypothetical protein N6H18_06115 [Reichenbachiella agarivorans]
MKAAHIWVFALIILLTSFDHPRRISVTEKVRRGIQIYTGYTDDVL